jgi:hypothetical protein
MKKQVAGYGKCNVIQFYQQGVVLCNIIAPNIKKLTKKLVKATAKAHVAYEWADCALLDFENKVIDAMDNPN